MPIIHKQMYSIAYSSVLSILSTLAILSSYIRTYIHTSGLAFPGQMDHWIKLKIQVCNIAFTKLIILVTVLLEIVDLLLLKLIAQAI